MTEHMRPFYARQIQVPIPGELAEDAALYIGLRELEGLAPTSLYEYHRELTRLATLFPTKRAADFTMDDLQTYLVRRTMMPDERTGKKLHPNTRRKVMNVLSGFFTWAVKSGRCPGGSPMVSMKIPTAVDREPTAWTPIEIDRILQAEYKQPRDKLFVWTLAHCGQRVGTTQRVRWENVRGLGTRECVIDFPPSKGDKRHTVPVAKREYHTALQLYRDLTGARPDSYVFQGRQGGYLSTQQCDRIVEYACRQAGVSKPWTAHQFRRTLITNLLEAGVELTVVSKAVANHASPATTMRHYRTVPEATARAAFGQAPW